MNLPPPIARFAGPVSREPGPGAAGITLRGKLDEPRSTPGQLSLIGIEAVQLPVNLADVTVEVSSASAVLLRAGALEWRIACKTWQLHRDVGAMFYAAVPPRPTPLGRRLGWRLLLGVAATAPGRWLLARQMAKKSNHT